MAPEYPELEFADADAWARWLAAEGERADGVILRVARKGSGIAGVTSAEAIEVALCHGWIDATVGKGDETHYHQRFTPRRARSKWSKVNRAKAEQLIADGRMQPAGLREVERARGDGRWDAAYDSWSTATVPDDLAAALDAEPGAREFFDALDRHNRYAILHRTHDAKKPETRARRIAKFVAMCAAGERIHPS
jgi:uncharacterized protein YdeI (YjbR/CyaY-like superfamily)